MPTTTHDTITHAYTPHVLISLIFRTKQVIKVLIMNPFFTSCFSTFVCCVALSCSLLCLAIYRRMLSCFVASLPLLLASLCLIVPSSLRQRTETDLRFRVRVRVRFRGSVSFRVRVRVRVRVRLTRHLSGGGRT
jgi:hypothetical protein